MTFPLAGSVWFITVLLKVPSIQSIKFRIYFYVRSLIFTVCWLCKFTDVVIRNLVKRSLSRRRGATVTSDLDDIQTLAPRTPRRAPVIHLDVLGDDSLHRLLDPRDSVDSFLSLQWWWRAVLRAQSGVQETTRRQSVIRQWRTLSQTWTKCMQMNCQPAVGLWLVLVILGMLIDRCGSWRGSSDGEQVLHDPLATETSIFEK